MANFNIDIKSTDRDKDKLEAFCDFFYLSNILHSEACFVCFNNKSAIDLLLKNKPLDLKKAFTFKAGVNEVVLKLSSCKLKVTSYKMRF